MSQRSTLLWYKDAIIYQLHVRAFYDSVTDGIGDFGGLTQKLDYLEDLGVTALWLLPFSPSPLRDDGYDTSDYTDVHPSYGTLKDFQRFLKEAHRRGLRVITELVLNHSSDQHPWFQRSRHAEPGSRWRSFYVWSDDPSRYREARIIFKDFETSNWTWDPVAKAYYWHRFYSHQPDLNWENPEVREAMFEAMNFWLEMGVDGLRLDAVPYLFEREGTNCENLPETHAALKELRRHIDEKYSDKMLLAEANQWPEDAVAYFGRGDECHMAFHFPLMPRMFMAVRMEDRYPMTDILRLTPPIPQSCQWAMFLRNHDELTLEMVTDEERDYMYSSYAQEREMRINLGIRRRLAPLLENDRRKIELMNALLFSLPGTPIIYYGDEIGMGDNVYLGDRHGVRTPMQWSADRNAGFSRANPQRLYLPVNIDPQYHYESVNVDAQKNNPHSLLWWMKRMIAQRRQFRAFGSGTLEFLYPSNRKILAFIRHFEDEHILVVANLSRFSQGCELDLAKYQGSVPVEVFGRNQFPPIADHPYFLSLGPHAFYWFHLQPKEAGFESISVGGGTQSIPMIRVEEPANIFSSGTRASITRILPRMLRSRAWYLGKPHTVRHAAIDEITELVSGSAFLFLVTIEYSDEDAETYSIPLSLAKGEPADAILRDRPDSVLAQLDGLGESAVLYGGIFDRQFNGAVLSGMIRRRKFKGQRGELVGGHNKTFRSAWDSVRSQLEPQAQRTQGTNTFIEFGQDFILKLYRKVETGINPDREISEFLSEQTTFPNSPRALGWLEYRQRREDEGESVTTLGTLTPYVRNATNGWDYTLDHLGLFFERALAVPRDDARLRELMDGDVLAGCKLPAPQLAIELLGSHADSVRMLGRRTAEMHLAFSSRPDLRDFAPEPFTDFYRHSLYHGMAGHVNRAFELLRNRLRTLPESAQPQCGSLLDREAEVRAQLHPLRDQRIIASRIRHHGDYHLGQVLFTGNDVVIMNFDGDPERPMSERRLKRSPLRDVSSMIRSFHYISHAVLFGQVPGILPSRDANLQLERWARIWHHRVAVEFLKGYFEAAGQASFIPRADEELRTLLRAYLLEKAMFELEHEIEYRQDWILIPVHGILQLLAPAGESPAERTKDHTGP